VNTEVFVIALFCKVDDEMKDVARFPLASLWPPEVVTLALLFVISGRKGRAFDRWVRANLSHLFPALPDRTNLFRLFASHEEHTARFLAPTTALGVADTFGVELLHPIREGRSKGQIGRKGVSNHRWIVGAKLCLAVNQFGLITGWDMARANTHDSAFSSFVATYVNESMVLADTGFHSAGGDPENMKLCRRGRWNVRMLIETVFSMITGAWNAKRMWHRTWKHLGAHFAYLAAAFNLLVAWHGLKPDKDGVVRLSIAQFVL